MAQFDVCRNASPRRRSDVPYILVLQHDTLSGLPRALAAPVVPAGFLQQGPKLNPLLEIEGQPHVVVMQDMAPIPWSHLGPVVANARDRDYEIRRALDLIFNGF